MKREISQKIDGKYNDQRGINLKVYTYEDIIKTIIIIKIGTISLFEYIKEEIKLSEVK